MIAPYGPSIDAILEEQIIEEKIEKERKRRNNMNFDVSKYRPFKDTEELIDWWLDNYNSHKVDRTYEEPLIWVKRKDGEWTSLITDFTANTVMVNGYVKTMNVLFYDNIFLDGKPCGVEIGKESD